MMVVCVESCKRFDIYPFSEILVLVHVRMQVARATPQTCRLHPHSLHREPAQLKRTTWDSSRYPAALQRPHSVSLASSCSAWTLHCWMGRARPADAVEHRACALCRLSRSCAAPFGCRQQQRVVQWRRWMRMCSCPISSAAAASSTLFPYGDSYAGLLDRA